MDLATGFEWQEIPTGGQMNWESAMSHCSGLTLDGGGWYLPNISELRSLIRNCADIETDGACGVQDECSACGVNSGEVCLHSSCSSDCYPSSCTDDEGPTGCYWLEELSGNCSWFWSSSSRADDTGRAWSVGFGYGGVYSYNKTDGTNARCVRSGP